MTSAIALSRRAFFKAGAAMGGGLLIGLCLEPLERPALGQESTAANPFLGWIRIGTDNRVTVKLPGTEMGQGHATAMPMLVAEELEADWKLVQFELTEGNPMYVNPRTHMQSTTGSMAVRGFSEPLRRMGAAARLMLIAAAAQRWQVPASECRAQGSRVLHAASGKEATYGELAAAAAKLPPPQVIPLKKPSEWRVVGKPTQRLDSEVLVTGRAVFGQDVRLPGMWMGAIALCPVFGGKLRRVEEGRALSLPGVKAVVPLRGGIPGRDDAVVVVADTTWHAFKGLEAVQIEWEGGAHATLDDAGLWAIYRKALDEPGAVLEQRQDAPKAFAEAAGHVDELYEVPYLAHAALEPMNATASYAPNAIEIWVPTQASGLIQAAVAKAFDLPLPQVKVHATFAGGGFGRRGDVDYAFPAVLASRAVGAPVQVVWSREEDMRHDSYRPATAIRMTAGLDSQGRVTGLAIKDSNSSIAARLLPQLARMPSDPIGHFGFTQCMYEFPALRVEYVMKNLPVPVGFWRSVASTYTAFAMESFVDTLAQATAGDAVRYRLDLLKNHPRHAAVLERLAAEAGWGKSLPPGQARGLALHDSQGSIVGEVVEISLAGKDLKVHRVVAVVDCGLVVNPTTAQAQIQGGIVFGLTAALYGEINIEAGRVKQANYLDYRVLRMAQMPDIQVHFMQNEEPHGGVGEPGVPPVAPALTNAICALTGQRIRTLPLSKHGYRLA